MSIYRQLVVLLDRAEQIRASAATDEEQYDLIFCESLSRKVFKLFNELGSSLDYYDPDTTYEEDMDAFINAFREKMERFESLKGIL